MTTIDLEAKQASQIELGKRYRDKITGTTGVATARSVYINGCVRVLLEWSKDGKPEDAWFDEPRLIPDAGEEFAPRVAATGGPMPAPSSRDPRR